MTGQFSQFLLTYHMIPNDMNAMWLFLGARGAEVKFKKEAKGVIKSNLLILNGNLRLSQ